MNDNIKLLTELVGKMQSVCKDTYKDVEDYIEEIKKNISPIPGAKALREPTFYLAMYSDATTSFNKCSIFRITLGKIIIDINSLLTQIKKIRTEVSLMSSLVSQLNTEKDKCLEYQKVLEIQQRSLDSQLRYYSSVQYVFGSPHWLQGE